MRKIYSERRTILFNAAKSELGGLLRVDWTPSGLHTIGHLLFPADEHRTAVEIGKRGITVTPIKRFSIAPTPYHGLVMGFSSARPSELKRGVQILAIELERLKNNAPKQQDN
jgi:GntR family transcriptional regulator/MocR family aminotransferase